MDGQEPAQDVTRRISSVLAWTRAGSWPKARRPWGASFLSFIFRPHFFHRGCCVLTHRWGGTVNVSLGVLFHKSCGLQEGSRP